jgi:hypothetical protein
MPDMCAGHGRDVFNMAKQQEGEMTIVVGLFVMLYVALVIVGAMAIGKWLKRKFDNTDKISAWQKSIDLRQIEMQERLDEGRDSRTDCD